MNLLFPLLFAFCICSGLSSCGTSAKPKPAEKEPEKPVVKGPSLVGRIASVPADKRFVLVQRYGKWEGQSGQILTTRGPDNRTANLRTTGEKLGEFAAADIQSGTVGLGDAVYLQHVPNPSVTPPTPEATPSEKKETEAPVPPTASENVQKNN